MGHIYILEYVIRHNQRARIDEGLNLILILGSIQLFQQYRPSSIELGQRDTLGHTKLLFFKQPLLNLAEHHYDLPRPFFVRVGIVNMVAFQRMLGVIIAIAV